MSFILYVFSIFTMNSNTHDLVWHKFDQGLVLASKENKAILIDIYTDWCGWCKKMDQETYSDPRVVKYLRDNFVLIRMNPETDEPVTYEGEQYPAAAFAQSMQVTGYPATAFFESNGKMITMVPGYIQTEDFLNILRYMAEKKYYTVSYEDFLKSK